MSAPAAARYATIDIGTNTALLLVAEVEPGPTGQDIVVLADHAEITRLGRGIGRDGALGEPGIEATLAALRTFAEVAGGLGARITAVGTEALRRAPNAEAFLAPAAAILGVPVTVIGGDREAELTFLAATRSFPEVLSRPLAVTDIGGGSTEVILAESGEVTFRHSFPLGSVRLTERWLHHDPPTDTEIAQLQAAIEAALTREPPPGTSASRTLIGIAGTVTTLAAMALELRTYDPTRVHGYRLQREQLNALVQRLRHATLSERAAMPGLDPRRADVILAGAHLLIALTRWLGADEVLVSDRGIRWGLLYEALARSAAA